MPNVKKSIINNLKTETMKKFTLNKFMNRLMLVTVLLVVTISNAQDIHFTFANAQNTNDGSNDFYEVDVMIQTILPANHTSISCTQSPICLKTK